MEVLMKKEQVLKILKKYQRGITGNWGGTIQVIANELFDDVATEIISLFQTGQSEVVIDSKKEMLDGYNQEPIGEICKCVCHLHQKDI
jgi:hypothetical protein